MVTTFFGGGNGGGGGQDGCVERGGGGGGGGGGPCVAIELVAEPCERVERRGGGGGGGGDKILSGFNSGNVGGFAADSAGGEPFEGGGVDDCCGEALSISGCKVG